MSKVIVYSTPTCPWCDRVKTYLNSKSVPYEDINVAADHNGAKEMIRKSGQRGVPVLDIDGSIIIGFNQKAINNTLGL